MEKNKNYKKCDRCDYISSTHWNLKMHYLKSIFL